MNPNPATRPTVLPTDETTTVPPASAGGSTDSGQRANAPNRGPFPDLPVAFGRYVLQRLLGAGGMGAVYLAHDSQLDRDVALKIPEFHKAGGKDRFLREARLAATLTHANLCPVYDAGEIDGRCYLTMPYLEGRPLSAFLHGKPVTVRAAVAMARQLAMAMSDAHAKGIVHRDLKPANVMITPKKVPIIMDFGLAYRANSAGDERLTQEGTVMGTPAYMPPEQVNGDVAAMGPASDVYSLGVILYEMLTGHVPFTGQFGTLISRIISEQPITPSNFRPEITGDLNVICARALAKEPRDRYPNMAAFAAALDAVLANKPLPQASRPVEFFSLAPEQVQSAESAIAQMFPSDVTSSHPPPKRPSHLKAMGREPHKPRRRRKRSKRHTTAWLVGIIIAAVCLFGLTFGIYRYATRASTDRAALAAIQRLDENPNDEPGLKALSDVLSHASRYQSATVFAAGRALALYRNHWDRAAELLRDHGDSGWRRALVAESKKPQNVADVIAVGDLWWAVATEESGTPRFKVRWHAAENYLRALAMPGAKNAEAEKRLKSSRGVAQEAMTRHWLQLPVIPLEPTKSDRAAPAAWRAVGFIGETGPRSWTMTLSPRGQKPQLSVAIDGDGKFRVDWPDGVQTTGPAKVFGQTNEVTVVLLPTSLEVYINGLTYSVPIQPAEALTAGAVCVAEASGSTSEIRSFEFIQADGVPTLTERITRSK